MNDLSKPRTASGVALLGGALLLAAPLALGLYAIGAYAAFLLGLAGIVIALKTLFRPQPIDSWLLVGTGALAIAAAFVAGGAALWVHLVGGAAILGAGLWRRMIIEPEGDPRISPS
jgi:hypothetical protein